MSVDETLAAIDAAVGCQQCGKPLDGSVSDDFDTEECQAEWHAARASRLVDYEADANVDPVQVSLRIDSAALEAVLVAMREVHVTYRRAPTGAAFDELIRTHDMLRATLQNGDSE